MTETFTGNRGLAQEEALIFEQDSPGRSGVDLPAPAHAGTRLGNVKPRSAIGLPGLSEPQVVRHYTRLSQQNYAIDAGLYPLGSCTMKHNPRLNEKAARMPGFADLHPLQPQSTVQGALELIDQLATWLKTLTGMPAVALSPAAGAHGEYCGMIAIRAALEARGDKRRKVLVPESAHGTNPATAAALGFEVESIPATEEGRVDLAALKAKLGPDVAGIMLTNPNTCGLFERDIKVIADAVHAAGGFFYCDGANFNAIVGRVRPADLGVDAMHINLHKTFSTPHGGGGPGAGPVGVGDLLLPFLPAPRVLREGDGTFRLERPGERPTSIGRLRSFVGNTGVLVRAYAYIRAHGGSGLRQVSDDAVLAANYLKQLVGAAYEIPYDRPCKHEFVASASGLRKRTGVRTLDIAKRLIDYGFHPPTVYFPLIVDEAMLIEPTETESIDTLDAFAAALVAIAGEAESDRDLVTGAPHTTPVRRLDEATAARHPNLRWRPMTGAQVPCPD
jgi:glycine dehydrogenase subunit 2